MTKHKTMTQKKDKLNNTLVCLTSAAFALFGDNNVASALTTDKPIASYRLSNYTEGNTAGSERYDITINQFRIVSPLGDDYSIGAEIILEKMSGASPWYSLPDANGKPVQIMSGATIEEERRDIKVSGSKIYNNISLGLALGASSENDYDANYLNINGEYETENKQLSWYGGLSLSDDKLSPTDAILFGRVEKAKKQSKSINIGRRKIINRHFLLSSSIGFTQLDGFLSDPYKLARTLDGSGNV